MLGHSILLALSTTIWGFGFIATKMTFSSFDPYWSHALRFIVAGILGMPIILYFRFRDSKNKMPLKEALYAALFLTGTLLFQTIGLSLTTVAKSGFITTLYSFFVPLTMMVLYQKKFKATFWLLVFIALIGMAFLCNLEVKELNWGDFFTLICSLFASFHIIYIGNVAKKVKNPIEFNLLQNMFVGIIGLVLALVIKGKTDFTPLYNIHSEAFKGILFLSIVSSMIAFSIQVIAQKKIPTHIASLIFLLESPFAAWFGYLVFNERLNNLNLIGAGLILIAVFLVPILGREVTASTK